MTTTETSLVIWLNIVTIVAGSVRLLSAHVHINCIVNDGLVNAMPNVQKTLLQFITLVVCPMQCMDRI